MSWRDGMLRELLEVEYPIVQAPMGRVATPELVAEASSAGALGSLPAAFLPPDALREQIAAVQSATDGPFAVNLFAPFDPGAPSEEALEGMAGVLQPWRERLGVGGERGGSGRTIPFEDQIEVVLAKRPAVFSFTFGIPPAEVMSALGDAGVKLIGTATTASEAALLEEAGCDAVVAQGSEAGGHRGTFAVPFEQALVGLVALVPQVVDRVSIPVIAAGAIMDGRGIAAVLALGAGGAQLGTAFIGCPEAGAPEAYVSSLAESDESATTVTTAFTGRHARGLRTQFFDEIERSGAEVPPYPAQAELVAPLMQAGMERGDLDTVMRLAGQGAAMVRRLPAAELVAALAAETDAAIAERLT